MEGATSIRLKNGVWYELTVQDNEKKCGSLSAIRVVRGIAVDLLISDGCEVVMTGIDIIMMYVGYSLRLPRSREIFKGLAAS